MTRGCCATTSALAPTRCLSGLRTAATLAAGYAWGAHAGRAAAKGAGRGAWPRALAPHDDELESEYEEMGSR